jgi:hypothetical protein
MIAVELHRAADVIAIPMKENDLGIVWVFTTI